MTGVKFFEKNLLKRALLLLLAALLQTGCATRSAVFGLEPEYPQALQKSSLGSPPHGLISVKVDSLTPEFKWESLPVEKFGKDAEVRGVAYELRVFLSKDGHPGGLAYYRDGLKEARHKMEEPLSPGTDYLWTVRARFLLNGKERVTEWSSSKHPPGYTARVRSSIVPDPNYHRFRTPEK